jgi:hypothetical protein
MLGAGSAEVSRLRRLQVPPPAWRATTEFASRIARPSSPLFSRRSLATFARGSLNPGVTAGGNNDLRND